MSPFDVVNGSFELLASLFVAVSARRVWVDRRGPVEDETLGLFSRGLAPREEKTDQ